MRTSTVGDTSHGAPNNLVTVNNI